MNTLSFIIFVSFFYSLLAQTNNTIYVFAYSWTPEFCYGNTYPGCSSPNDYWKTHFTVHGLWPQYITSGYPSYCTTEKFNASSIENMVGMETLEQYWPNVQEDPSSENYSSFWEHEWAKHGTCSGLIQSDYFEIAIQLIKVFGTPSEVMNSVGKSVYATTIRDSLGGSQYVSLQCNSQTYLSGAYTCWSQINSIPQIQIECPSDVVNEDTCKTTDITIVDMMV